MSKMFSIDLRLADNGLDRVLLKQYRKVVFYWQDLNGLRIPILKNTTVRFVYISCLMVKFGRLNFIMDFQMKYAIFINCICVVDLGELLDFSKL